MATLTVMMGPPASGKTTWVERNANGAQVVSTDQIRYQLGHPPGSGHLATFKMAYRMIGYYLALGQDVVFDSTGLNPESRRRLREMAKASSAECRLVVVHSSPAQCRRRDQARSLPVSDENMDDMLRSYDREYPVAVGAEEWTSVQVVDGNG